MKIEDLKCCGNCINYDSYNRFPCEEHGIMHIAECDYCNNWVWDEMTRKERDIE